MSTLGTIEDTSGGGSGVAELETAYRYTAVGTFSSDPWVPVSKL